MSLQCQLWLQSCCHGWVVLPACHPDLFKESSQQGDGSVCATTPATESGKTIFIVVITEHRAETRQILPINYLYCLDTQAFLVEYGICVKFHGFGLFC